LPLRSIALSSIVAKSWTIHAADGDGAKPWMFMGIASIAARSLRLIGFFALRYALQEIQECLARSAWAVEELDKERAHKYPR
jgi:hypothetical protein